MAVKRSERVGDEMKRIIARAIQNDLKDPRIPPLTSVTSMRVAGDIGHAYVGISVLGSEQQQQEAMQGLESAKGFLRTKLARETQMRQVPELHFELDNSAEEGARMDRLIDQAMGRAPAADNAAEDQDPEAEG